MGRLASIHLETRHLKKWAKHLNLFRPDHSGPETVLGDLETAVMEVCWQLESFGIKDVHARLSEQRVVAYTTVQTTIERLYRKGMLRREGRGRTFTYGPAVARDEFLKGITKHVLDSLFGNFAEPTVASLVDILSAQEPEHLDRLLAAIEARRANGEA